MARKSADIEKELRLLPARERARLVRRLIASLDAGQDSDAEQGWLDEAERRLGRYQTGATQARSAGEVFADLEQRLK